MTCRGLRTGSGGCAQPRTVTVATRVRGSGFTLLLAGPWEKVSGLLSAMWAVVLGLRRPANAQAVASSPCAQRSPWTAPLADADDVRRLAMSLPHVVEIASAGFDFRVGDKGFVWSYPERRPGKPRLIRTDVAVLFVGDVAEKQALLLGEPKVFFTASGYENLPLVRLRLAQVGVARLRELLTDAWRMRAPEDLVGDLPLEGRPPGRPR